MSVIPTPNINYTKSWTSAEDFPTYEASEEQVRADMQCLFDEIKAYINNTLCMYLDAARHKLDRIKPNDVPKTTSFTITPSGELGLSFPKNSFHLVFCLNTNNASNAFLQVGTTNTGDDMAEYEAGVSASFDINNPGSHPVVEIRYVGEPGSLVPVVYVGNGSSNPTTVKVITLSGAVPTEYIS